MTDRHPRPANSPRQILTASLMGGGVDMWLNTIGLTAFGTLRHKKSDAAATGLAADFKPIDYPKPDGKLSFDRLTNVAFSFTNHDEAQPAHLVLKDPTIPIGVNLTTIGVSGAWWIQTSRRLEAAGFSTAW